MAYTTIDDPSAYHQTTLYTGNGGADRAVTNGGNSDLQPDWVWIKNRDATDAHMIFDSSRGVTKRLSSDSNAVEVTDGDTLDAFQSDGFRVDADVKVNTNAEEYVAWQWKANGGTRTTVTESGANPGGGHQSDTTAGFSIVDYVGTGGAGHVTHGLGAVPEWIVFKNRDETESWLIYHVAIGNGKGLRLDTTAAVDTTANHFANTTPNANTIVVGGNPPNNKDGVNYIAYCFAPIQGYSKMGSFIGNGSTDGPFIYLGFRPAWILYKRATDGTNNWGLIDNARDSHNPCISAIATNLDNDPSQLSAKGSGDMLSNGWKIGASAGSRNADGVEYIYIAFAESPFVSSTGIPTTAA